MIAPSLDGWKFEIRGWVDGRLAALDRAPVDHAQRHQNVADRARVEPFSDQLLGKILHVIAVQINELAGSERGTESRVDPDLVCADYARLVRSTVTTADRAVLHSGDERVG